MKQWMEYTFDVNGFKTNCRYSKKAVEEIFQPLIRRLTKMHNEKKARLIVFMAAAPAVGKTTLTKFIEYLSIQEEGVTKIQALGLDGFHYHSDYIQTHTVVVDGKEVPMKDVKGCPETYDVEKLKEKLAAMKTGNITWPVYDRNIHDVIEDVEVVDQEVILIEGNWLLLNQGEWKKLKDICDYSILIRGDEEILKGRLIERKIKGGLSEEEAVRFYERSDSLNVKRVLSHSLSADLELSMTEDADYEIIGGF